MLFAGRFSTLKTEFLDNYDFVEASEVHPRILQCRSSWDVCFWLTTERTVMVSKAVPTDKQTEILNNIEDIIALGEKCISNQVMSHQRLSDYSKMERTVLFKYSVKIYLTKTVVSFQRKKLLFRCKNLTKLL